MRKHDLVEDWWYFALRIPVTADDLNAIGVATPDTDDDIRLRLGLSVEVSDDDTWDEEPELTLEHYHRSFGDYRWDTLSEYYGSDEDKIRTWIDAEIPGVLQKIEELTARYVRCARDFYQGCLDSDPEDRIRTVLDDSGNIETDLLIALERVLAQHAAGQPLTVQVRTATMEYSRWRNIVSGHYNEYLLCAALKAVDTDDPFSDEFRHKMDDILDIDWHQYYPIADSDGLLTGDIADADDDAYVVVRDSVMMTPIDSELYLA